MGCPPQDLSLSIAVYYYDVDQPAIWPMGKYVVCEFKENLSNSILPVRWTEQRLIHFVRFLQILALALLKVYLV